MNIKNIVFFISIFFSISCNQLSYSKDLSDEHHKSMIISEPVEAQTNVQQDKEFLSFVKETFQLVVEQTKNIEYNLQQIELILSGNKIKFNDKKISKADLLNQIKEIKAIVQTIFEFYTTQIEQDEAIFMATCFNTAFINYFLPTIQNDITDLNVNNFDKSVAQNFELIKNELKDINQIKILIEKNQEKLKLLTQVSDNIGLTTLNKIYRYLDTKTLPWYGKTTIATAKDIAFWSTIGLAAYTIGVYWMPRDSIIYGTSKKYNPSDFQEQDTTKNSPLKVLEQKFKELKEQQKQSFVDTLNPLDKEILLVEEKIEQEKKYLSQKEKERLHKVWTVGDQKYTYKTCQDLFPLKNFLGDLGETRRTNNKENESEVKKLESKFGIYSYIHKAAVDYSDPFIAFTCSALWYYTKGSLQELYKNAQVKFNQSIDYYFKGDNAINKNSLEIPKTYFKDMIGGEHLEKIARELTDYLKNPIRYERAGIAPSTGYLLVGPSQTGKSFFAKALKTLIDEEFADEGDKVKFFSITPNDVKYFDGFARIFNIARRDAPCILFIDELDLHGARRDRDAKNTHELLTSINGLETDQNKKVIVIAATNKPEELDFALKQKGRLGTVITFDYPTYECRKSYLKKQLYKKNIILSDDMIDTIAQETDGQTYNMIDDIIKQALQLATYETRPVAELDFEVTLDREIRKIKPNTSMSEQEKELVAIYQAGQATARHILDTNHQIVKITIDAVDKPIKSKEGFGVINENKGDQHENLELLPDNRVKPTRLGFVFTMSKINNHELLSDLDKEKELMALLAGQAALELIKGTSYDEFGKEDRAKVLEALEKKISQGTPVTDTIRLQAIGAKEILSKKIKNDLQNHTKFITTITNELLKSTTINKIQWQSLAASYPISK